MAISNGMTSAIMNPLHDEVRSAVMAADVLAGHDQDCGAWIATNREGGEGAAAAGGRPRRRGGRRARVEG
jgi:5-methyltetrahydrofolate--homocysteine methyltransferase